MKTERQFITSERHHRITRLVVDLLVNEGVLVRDVDDIFERAKLFIGWSRVEITPDFPRDSSGQILVQEPQTPSR